MPLTNEPPRKPRRSLRRMGASGKLHYYAKCVAILSKAKPWERVRVVKALCLLVGINRPNDHARDPRRKRTPGGKELLNNQETMSGEAGRGFAGAHGSAVFGSVFGKIEIMTPSEEKLVSVGICPRCIPPEGRPPQMRLLGDFGPMRSWQCGRCKNVWITSPPNARTQPSARRT